MKIFALALIPILFVFDTGINGYRKWRKVNPNPVKMLPSVATLCAPPQVPPSPSATPSNPHQDRYLTVYVNERGSAAMASPTDIFPVGSIIVKEKLPTPNATQPELLTVMVKREQGYFPEGGDWEYRVYDGQLRQMEAGRLTLCAACHQKAVDRVFRSYGR